MKAPRFRNWFAKLSALNQPQRRQLLDALHPAAGIDQVAALIAQARGRVQARQRFRSPNHRTTRLASAPLPTYNSDASKARYLCPLQFMHLKFRLLYCY